MKNSLIDDLRKIVNSKSLKSDLQTLILNYDQLLTIEKKQDFFNTNTNVINEEFKTKLKGKYASLTPSEIEICGCVFAGLTNNEIAIFRSSNPLAINAARYRIRKKMELEKNKTILDALKLL